MEGNEGEMEEFGPSLSEELIIQTFPFSVLVPAALEARNKLPADMGETLRPNEAHSLCRSFLLFKTVLGSCVCVLPSCPLSFRGGV